MLQEVLGWVKANVSDQSVRQRKYLIVRFIDENAIITDGLN